MSDSEKEQGTRSGGTARAGGLLQNLLERLGVSGRLQQYRAWQVWETVVGPQIAARTRLIRIREGVLEVRVDHPVWMQQLQLLKPQILSRLNERLGTDTLHDLFLRRGKIEKDPLPVSPSAPPTRSLSEKELEKIEATLASLADPEIRRRLRAIMIRQASLTPPPDQD